MPEKIFQFLLIVGHLTVVSSDVIVEFIFVHWGFGHSGPLFGHSGFRVSGFIFGRSEFEHSGFIFGHSGFGVERYRFHMQIWIFLDIRGWFFFPGTFGVQPRTSQNPECPKPKLIPKCPQPRMSSTPNPQPRMSTTPSVRQGF